MIESDNAAMRRHEAWLLTMVDGSVPWVYFISSGRYVKIGTAINVRRRLYTVRVAAPEQAWLIALTEGGKDKESKLHDDMRPWHYRGEWFVLNADVERAIRNHRWRPACLPHERPFDTLGQRAKLHKAA